MTTKTKKTTAKKAKASKATKQPAEKKAKKVSQLDAAAAVLEKSKDPMTVRDLVGTMESKGLWKSPGGKTPHSTLAAAIAREITVKGGDSRFAKTGRGLFAHV